MGANDNQWVFDTLLAAQREEVASQYYVARLNRGLEVSSPHEFKDLAEAHKHFENLDAMLVVSQIKGEPSGTTQPRAPQAQRGRGDGRSRSRGRGRPSKSSKTSASAEAEPSKKADTKEN